MKLLLGIDLGTSFVKAAVIDADSGQTIASAQYPEKEAGIKSLQPGWAEQSPALWWEYVKMAILKCHASVNYSTKDIQAIGIAYQMHGLVLVDKHQQVLRDAIIWCDSRATNVQEFPMGNFTAGKLQWVRKNEPEIYKQIHKFMLPGDFIAMKLTGTISTTISALSEGNFIDLRPHDIIQYDFDGRLFPQVKVVFSNHGTITKDVAKELGLCEDVPVSYKAGDQLNNAFALNVKDTFEMAATAGTSGVLYAITNQEDADSFIHVNGKIAKLLCINGAGSMYSWTKKLCGNRSYSKMNEVADTIPPGSEGLIVLPFGNGAERMLQNQVTGAQFINLDLNKHTPAHIFRAVQEGIAFSFRYGLDCMVNSASGRKISPDVIRAGHANLFLSETFVEAFVHATNTPVEMYDTEGSRGAAIGAGVGAEIYKNAADAFVNFKPIKKISPEPAKYVIYENHYHQWKGALAKLLDKTSYHENQSPHSIFQGYYANQI